MDESTSYHYVAYVNRQGTIWELDGRRAHPLQKGSCTSEDFGVKVASILQGYT